MPGGLLGDGEPGGQHRHQQRGHLVVVFRRAVITATMTMRHMLGVLVMLEILQHCVFSTR